MRTAVIRTLLAAAIVAGPAVATARPVGAMGGAGAFHMTPPLGLLPTIPQMTPQYNTPGPQLALPEPGSPVQQLAPLGSSNSLPANPSQQTSPID
jgi:hypothetical protein